MELSHVNAQGRARMVDVSEKEETQRIAIAYGKICMKKETLDKITGQKIEKGDVLSVAQVAGIMAAKRTFETIPMCHPLLLTGADIKFKTVQDGIEIKMTVKTTGKTGVEMEALNGVSASALTIYDMCKAVDREMRIEKICLLEKDGGRSGHFLRDNTEK
ncbi:MAG: cyclic pyranopterin monophosphate synthase MoaC [Clostridia bacterium]|nr:cyclic pyranopterin monophosphate synthase MoaC [Clostridia bacterium]NCD01815.1 cyclic pyranopterin monophosphate synthase MoaC [Clostridia bacterium]